MNSQLAVKVEGVVQVTCSHQSSGRSVRAVQVTIQSNPAHPIGLCGKVGYSSVHFTCYQHLLKLNFF
jgi:hypothetical protein